MSTADVNYLNAVIVQNLAKGLNRQDEKQLPENPSKAQLQEFELQKAKREIDTLKANTKVLHDHYAGLMKKLQDGNDQAMTMFKKRITDLNAENVGLKTENTGLKTENAGLKKKLSQYEAPYW